MNVFKNYVFSKWVSIDILGVFKAFKPCSQIVNSLEIVKMFGISEDSFAEIVNSLQIVKIFTNLRNHCK